MLSGRAMGVIPNGPLPTSGILVEAEAFDNYGGWVVDSQWELEMGSPYLLAHGNGKPVADASTEIKIPELGDYNIFVRTKDWVPRHHPGRFTLSIDGETLPIEFGGNDKDWNWEYGGKVRLWTGRSQLVLHDLTGFCGRCDAIFISKEDIVPPNENDDVARTWRKRLCDLPEQPAPAGSFDVVVVGGGIPGSSAALSAARLGLKVALIQNRPVLGGNGSMETGLRPRGINGPIVDEIKERHPNGDLSARDLLDAEPNATLFLEHTVYAAEMEGSAIRSVDTRHAQSGREIRITAPVFIDASGRALLALLVGADNISGSESQAEHGESLAAARRDNTHHGNTMFFRTRMADSPVAFPPVPWATEVSKDYSNLGGQLIRPSLDNGEGPVVVPPPASAPRRMKGPLTHFWEYGQHLDMYTKGEHIRDHLLRAIYGTFSNVKTMEPVKYANLGFDFVAFVAATGEFLRYRGDHILTENDIRNHVSFPDAVVENDGAFCLHYPGDEKYDFRLKYWGWDERDNKPYAIPFRCLYSRNISNLMMAGKHISVTHIAGSSTKFMGNGAQHGIATASAAYLCKKYRTTPKGLCVTHMAELTKVAAEVTETGGRKVLSRL